MPNYKVGVHTPSTIDWKPGDKLEVDEVGNTALCIGYEISSGNKYDGYTSIPVWFENEEWVMLHPTDMAGTICAPKGAVISPRMSFSY